MVLRCDVHDFSCSKPKEMSEHFGLYEHEHVGVGRCGDCGEDGVKFRYVGKLKNGVVPPSRCEECTEKLKEELLK